ncbi:hypothetical protein [Micromonospora sp. NPDC003816]|uniref:hypothetical protein n=1 Tax=Micromonospora sp. NPDC003816 TaxID=3364224 RepID=UPI0036C9C58C
MNLEKNSQDACASALFRYGFRPKRRGILLQPRDTADVEGWLGLNLATWGLPNTIQINPVVGVRHVPLENALVAHARWKTPVACVSRPLGYLMPQNAFAQWAFPSGGDLAAPAEDLATAVAEYGQPFIEKWANWETFSNDISESKLLLDNQKSFVLPLISAINGDRVHANHLIRRELDRIAGASDVYSESYQRFAESFMKNPL